MKLLILACFSLVFSFHLGSRQKGTETDDFFLYKLHWTRYIIRFEGIIEGLGMTGVLNWRVINCVSWSEIKVSDSCSVGLGLEIFCPRYLMKINIRNRAVERSIPFLRSYVFAKFDPEDFVLWHDIRNITGVLRILPGSVTEEEMLTITSYIGTDGYLIENMRNEAILLNIGDPVELTQGVFAGHSGVVTDVDQEKQTAAIKTALLGREIVINQPLAWCERDAPAAAGGERVASFRSNRRERRLRSRQRETPVFAEA